MKNNDKILKRINDIIEANKDLNINDFNYKPNTNYLFNNIEFDFLMDNDAKNLFKSAIKELNFNINQLGKIEKIVKGIMKIDNSNTCKAEHIAEAIQYVI